jgi:hypothetical protein
VTPGRLRAVDRALDKLARQARENEQDFRADPALFGEFWDAIETKRAKYAINPFT